MLLEQFKHLNVHLMFVQKFSNFFVSLNRALEIFGKFFEDYSQDNFSYIYFSYYLGSAKA